MIEIIKRTECSKQAKGNDPIKSSGINPDGRVMQNNSSNTSNNNSKKK